MNKVEFDAQYSLEKGIECFDYILPLSFYTYTYILIADKMKKEGIKSYYQAKIEECELVMNEKSQDLRRLEAQRNALNAKGIFDATLCHLDM